jgi:hypothetical protein
MLKKALLKKSNNKYQIDFDYMASLREKKQRGVGFIDSSISAMGQREICAHPGMSETRYKKFNEFVYKKYGSVRISFHRRRRNNGCYLHIRKQK